METRKLKKYLIKKGKDTDMISSLKKVDNKLINKALKDGNFDSIEELAEYIIDSFEAVFDMTKDDMFTQMFFTKLINCENTMVFAPYESDVEDFLVFPYDNGSCYTYYIPNEIKKIIKDAYDI